MGPSSRCWCYLLQGGGHGIDGITHLHLFQLDLVTIVIAVVIYFMGHFTEDARNYWLHSHSGGATKELKILTQSIALIFPDFQLYNIIDSTIEGKKVTEGIFSRLAILTLFYSGIYSVLAWFTFRKKEF